jgi:hypothetical protein
MAQSFGSRQEELRALAVSKFCCWVCVRQESEKNGAWFVWLNIHIVFPQKKYPHCLAVIACL